MAKSNVQFTKDNEYYTPKEFVSRFGSFDYDPATTKEKFKKVYMVTILEGNGIDDPYREVHYIYDDEDDRLIGVIDPVDRLQTNHT